jgi:hypothetical protein
MTVTGCRYWFWLAVLVTGCEYKSHSLYEVEKPDAGRKNDAGSGLRPECETEDNQLPPTLDCTGLYEDIGAKKVAASAISFTPAYPLWSDGADKQRWISLPPGTQIDSSDPDEWIFPVGTKLWKEFQVDNKRVETRIFWKATEDTWRWTTYAWNADESEARQHFGGDIKLPNGQPYHLPEDGECRDCHRGQPDNVLGFGAVNLGLRGASGLTLKRLVEEDLLTDPPKRVELSIGADSTGLDSDGVPLVEKALGILHTNCGLTCHNDHPDRKANLTTQNLRLQMEQLDGSPPDATWNVLRTAVGVHTQGAQIGGMFTRIMAGDPENSYALRLMKYRNPNGMGGGQMPPIASRLVDQEAVGILTKWISLLPHEAKPDAGTTNDASVPDAAVFTGPDAGAGMDAGTSDAGADASMDASVVDADAGTPEADAEAGTDAALEPDAADADPAADAETDAEIADAASDPEASLEAGDEEASTAPAQ